MGTDGEAVEAVRIPCAKVVQRMKWGRSVERCAEAAERATRALARGGKEEVQRRWERTIQQMQAEVAGSRLLHPSSPLQQVARRPSPALVE